MSLANIREQIKAILSGVSGIGVVHDYDRWASTWEKFLDQYKDEATGKINGWAITRTKTPEEADSFEKHARDYEFTVRGFYGLKDEDASEIVFQDLVEDICTAFRTNFTLNSTCDESGPMQVVLVENRVFGSVLCHYCELSIMARERVTNE